MGSKYKLRYSTIPAYLENQAFIATIEGYRAEKYRSAAEPPTPSAAPPATPVVAAKKNVG